MGAPRVDQAHFRTVFDKTTHSRNHYLEASNQEAFLALTDPATRLPKAPASVFARYSVEGLTDHTGVRRVVRPVELPKGMRIYKFTGGIEKEEVHGPLAQSARLTSLIKSEVLYKFDTVSPWFAAVGAYEEDAGVVPHFRTMMLNAAAFPGPGKLTMREYARMMSAVVLEWNRLNYYVEVTLDKPVKAYFGMFEEQVSVGKDNREAFASSTGGGAGWGWTSNEPARVVVEDGNTYVLYKGEDGKYLLPDYLGGMEAWQFYIPAFFKSDITANSEVVIPSTNHKALAAHFGCPDIEGEVQQQRVTFRQLKSEAQHLARTKRRRA